MKQNSLSFFRQLDWDSRLDLLLPISLFALLLQDNTGFWMTIVLVFWLGLKVSIRAFHDQVYWYLLAVLAFSLAKLFRASAVSSPTDLLLVLLAFAVGVGRDRQQWKSSLWILASIGVVSLIRLNILHGSQALNFLSIDSLAWLLPRFRIMIGEIHFNLSGYLLGSVSLIGYGLWRHSQGKGRWWAFGFAAIAYGLAFLTGSRASAFLPIASILCAELVWKYRRMIQEKAMLLAMAFVAIGLAFSLMIYLPNGPLSAASASESARSKVAQCFFSRATDSWPHLLRGNGGDNVSEYCEDQVVVMHRDGRVSTPHAHNSYLQVFADYGIFSASLLLLVFVLSLRNALNLIAASDGLLGTIGFSLSLFLFFFGLFDSTLLSVSINQVLTGYLLAISWPKRVSAQ